MDKNYNSSESSASTHICVMRQTPDAIHAQQTEDVFDAEAGFEVRMFDR